MMNKIRTEDAPPHRNQHVAGFDACGGKAVDKLLK
jgi:hypothetical protein